MVLKGVNWVHNIKIRSYGLERSQMSIQGTKRSNGLKGFNWVHNAKSGQMVLKGVNWVHNGKSGHMVLKGVIWKQNDKN